MLLELLGMQVWCLGEQVGRPGTWVQEEVREPVFTGSSLGLQSVVMGMEPGSAWVDLDPGSTETNQVLSTNGIDQASGSMEADPALG